MGRDAAALEGALAYVQATLELESNRDANGNATTRTRRAVMRRPRPAVDPWQNMAERFAVPVAIGDREVTVRTTDLGTVVNLNLASETELAILFEHVLADERAARQLAQAVLDWRDDDDLPRANGAEADDYRRANQPVRPANGPFQSLDDLQDVRGMTPTRLEQLRPFLTVDGTTRRVNVNAAPAVVLRTLPGMSEPLLTTILALRSRGRRVESIPALVSAVRSAGRVATGEREALARMLTESVSLDTRDVAVELTVSAPVDAQPARLIAVLHRNDDGMVGMGPRRW